MILRPKSVDSRLQIDVNSIAPISLKTIAPSDSATEIDMNDCPATTASAPAGARSAIPNHISVAIEDEIIGNADNFNSGSADSLYGEKGGLIQDRYFSFDGVRSLLHLLFERSSAHVNKRAESRQMIALVSESKPSEDYLVSAGFCFLLSLLAQEDPQVAACETMA